MSRTPIGRNFAFGIRERIFESDDAIEVDTSDHYELARKRVLFEDVALITYHREYGWTFLTGQIVLAFVFFIIGGFTYVGGGGWIATSIILAFAVPSTIAIFLRLIYRVDVISIFGKRSRATIRFSFKKKQARELYGRLCHRTRQVQTNIEESNRLIDAAGADESWRAEAPPTSAEQESTG